MQTRKALKTLSSGKLNYEDKVGPLAKHADRLLKKHAEKQDQIMTEKHRHSAVASLPVLEAARNKLSQVIGESVLPDDTPIVSRFDMFSVIKDASKADKNDQGLRGMALHLERLWHQEPLGVITAGALTRLRDHYQQNNMRSRVAEIIDNEVPKVAFNSLPVVNLIRIASEIKTQEDYNEIIARNHLDSDHPNHVRARTFIRTLLNRKADIEAADVVSGVDPKEYQEKTEQAKKQFEEFNKISPRPLPGESGGVKQMGFTEPGWKASKVRGGDIAARVAARIKKTADTVTPSVEAAEKCEDKESAEECGDKESAEKEKISTKDMGVEGSGMMPINAELERLAATGAGFQSEAVLKEGQQRPQQQVQARQPSRESMELAMDLLSEQANIGIGDQLNSLIQQAQQKYVEDLNAQIPAYRNSYALAYMLDENPGLATKFQGVLRKFIEQYTESLPAVAAYRKLVARIEEDIGEEFDITESESERYKSGIPGVEEPEIPEEVEELEAAEWEELAGVPEALEESEDEPEDEPEDVDPDIAYLEEEREMGEAEGSEEAMVEELADQLSALAAKKPKKTKKTVMSPKVNAQQPDQLSVPDGVLKKKTKLTQKRPNLKVAVCANNSMVDDKLDHLPISTPELAKTSLNYVNGLQTPPNWWLGTVKELKRELGSVLAAKVAGKMPPALLENMKGEGKDKEEKGGPPFGKGKGKPPFGGKKKPPFGKEKGEDRLENLKKKKGEIEDKILSGESYKVSSYSIGIKDNVVTVHSKKGSKEYQLIDINGAINDFIYLAGTEKDPTFPPLFYIKEGLRLKCPKCASTNHYHMPKEAADLSCGECNIIIPAVHVASMAIEESILTAYVPEQMQGELGDVFVKAAEKMSVDIIDTIGNCVEAHSIATSDQSKSEVWDMMVQAGFHPIALDVEDISIPEGAAPVSGLETPPAESEADIKDYTTIFKGKHAEDPEMTWEAAVIEYLPKVKDDIAAGHISLDEVISSAKGIFDSGGLGADLGGGLPAVMASLEKIAGDIPSTKVNPQQPDAEKIPKGVLGKDSDAEDPGDFGVGKPKTQVKPQGKFSPTKVDKESDSRDPGDFGAGKPKVQHPATDQQGTSLSDTNLGKDSETQMGKITKKMDSASKAAPNALRSR